MHSIVSFPYKALHMIRNSAASVIIVFVIALFALAYIQSNGGVKKSVKNLKEMIQKDGRKTLWRILWLLWTVILLHVTIIGRSIDYDPLSQVFTGWKVVKMWDTWNFDALYNILMFIPYTLLLYMGWPHFLSIGDQWPEVIRQSIKISFLSSLFIETTQLIFSCGTFQLSDLTYNTISGVIGGLIYFVVVRRGE